MLLYRQNVQYFKALSSALLKHLAIIFVAPASNSMFTFTLKLVRFKTASRIHSVQNIFV